MATRQEMPGHEDAATSTDGNGVSLIKWCSYYGDVSGMRFLLAKGESLKSLGENPDLDRAVSSEARAGLA